MHRRPTAPGLAAGTAILVALTAVGVTWVAATPAMALVAPRTAVQIDVTSGDPVDANGSGSVDVGDTIGYTYRVTNLGTATVTDVAIVDPLTGPADCPDFSDLAPGAVLECHEQYAVTQRDLDAGTVDNVAYARGLGPDGATVVTRPDRTSTLLAAVASMSVARSSDGPDDTNRTGRIDAGDLVDFSYTVTNTGDLTLSDVAVDDPVVVAAPCSSTVLAPGAVARCSGQHRLTQDEVDAGSVTAAVTAQALSPNQSTVTATAPPTSMPLQGAPAITLAMSHTFLTDDDHDGLADVGDQIAFTFRAYNSGSTTLLGVTISDPLLRAAGDVIHCPDSSLLTGEALICSATHTVTADDVLQPLVNTASVHATGTSVVTSPYVSVTIENDVAGTASVASSSGRWWLVGGLAGLLLLGAALAARIRIRRRVAQPA